MSIAGWIGWVLLAVAAVVLCFGIDRLNQRQIVYIGGAWLLSLGLLVGVLLAEIA